MMRRDQLRIAITLYVPAAGVRLPAVKFPNVIAKVLVADTRTPTIPVPAVSAGPLTYTLSVVASPVTVNVCSALVLAAIAAGVSDCAYATPFVNTVPPPMAILVTVGSVSAGAPARTIFPVPVYELPPSVTVPERSSQVIVRGAVAVGANA